MYSMNVSVRPHPRRKLSGSLGDLTIVPRFMGLGRECLQSSNPIAPCRVVSQMIVAPNVVRLNNTLLQSAYDKFARVRSAESKSEFASLALTRFVLTRL